MVYSSRGSLEPEKLKMKFVRNQTKNPLKERSIQNYETRKSEM